MAIIYGFVALVFTVDLCSCLQQDCLVLRDLNPLWVQSLQQRQEYHETSGIDDPNLPKQLKLSTFLKFKYGELRPASRKISQLWRSQSISLVGQRGKINHN
jgi:hypothetical protein